MATSLWPSSRDVVGLAFDARSQSNFREELLLRLARATSSELGVYCDARRPIEAASLINMKVAEVTAARNTVLERPEQMIRTNEALAQFGVVIDTELYSHSQWERLPNIEYHQGPQGVTSNLYFFWLDRRHEPVLINLSKVGGRYSDEERQRAQELLQTLILADTWPLRGDVDLNCSAIVSEDSLPSSWRPGRTDQAQTTAPRIKEAIRGSLAGLTDRQLEIIQYVAIGYSNAEIACACGISLHTVRNHLVRLFERYAVATRTELASRAYFGNQLPLP